MVDPMYVRTFPHGRPANPYADAARTWSALGFTVVPIAANKRAAVKWGPYSVHADHTDSPHITPAAAPVADWLRDWRDADRGALILDSRTDLPLAVIDLDTDDPPVEAAVIATYGPTPLRVSTGRGAHLFYSLPPGRRVTSRAGFIGPRFAFVDKARPDGSTALTSPVDVKASAAYVAASGSWHEGRGTTYTPSQPITAELLASLPLLDVDRYEREAAITRAARGAGLTAAQFAAMTDDEAVALVERDRRATTLARAGYRVRGYEDLGPRGWELPASAVGDLRRRAMLCPRHENTSTPAASLHEHEGSWFVTCHGSCDRSWIVVDDSEIEERDRQRRDLDDMARDYLDPRLAAPLHLSPAATADTGASPRDRWVTPAPAAPEPPAYLVDGRAIFDALTRHTMTVAEVAGADVLDTPRGPGGEPTPRAWRPSTMRIPRRLREQFDRLVTAPIDGRYISADALEPIEDHVFIAITSPTGSGKTHAIRRHIDRLRDSLGREPRVISVSHRRTLVAELRSRLGLGHTHLNAAGEVEITAGKIGSLAVCADSLAAVARQMKISGATIDLLVLDESESTLSHLHTCQRSPVERSGIFDALREIARSSTQIIAADATMSALTLDGVARLVGLSTARLLDRGALLEDRRPRAMLAPLDLVWLDKAGDAGLAAMQMARDGVAFFYHCGSKARAKALVAELRAAHPHLRWPLVSGDHDDADGRDFLADPCGWIEANRGQIGGVIYTSALESGVSIDAALDPIHGDTVIVEAGGHQTTQQLIQAASRARRAARWFVHAPTGGLASWLDESELSRALLEGREDSAAGVTKRGGWHGARVERDSEQFAAYVSARVHVDRSRTRLGLDLWSWLASEGYTIHHPTVDPDDIERRAIGERLAERRDQIREAEIDAVVAADDTGMSVGEAERILDSTDIERRPAALKRTIREFYGKADRAEVAFDHDGKGRSQIARWCDLVALLRGQGDAVVKGDTGELVVSAGATERLRRAAVVWGVLEMAGVTVEDVLGITEGSRLTMTKAGEEIDTLARQLVISPDQWDRIWTWMSGRQQRDAIRLAVGCDPWRQVGDDERRALIDASKTVADEDVTACPGYVRGWDPLKKRATPRTAPEGHSLIRVIQAAAKKIGLVICTRRVRLSDDRISIPFIDLNRARMIRDLAGAHYQRQTGEPVQPRRTTAAEFVDRHMERERILSREVAYERADQSTLDALIARNRQWEEQFSEMVAVEEEEERDLLATASYRMGQAVAGSSPVSRSLSPLGPLAPFLEIPPLYARPMFQKSRLSRPMFHFWCRFATRPHPTRAHRARAG